MRSAFFWDIRSHLGLFDPWIWDIMSRNVGRELPFYAVRIPRTAQISSCVTWWTINRLAFARLDDGLRINNQQDASSIQNFILSRNSTYFGHLLCPSSGVISCTRGNWYVSCRLCGHCLGESGSNQLPCVQLITPDDGHSRCPKHVVSWQNKIWILDASCWLLIRRVARCTVTRT